MWWWWSLAIPLGVRVCACALVAGELLYLIRVPIFVHRFHPIISYWIIFSVVIRFFQLSPLSSSFLLGSLPLPKCIQNLPLVVVVVLLENIDICLRFASKSPLSHRAPRPVFVITCSYVCGVCVRVCVSTTKEPTPLAHHIAYINNQNIACLVRVLMSSVVFI